MNFLNRYLNLPQKQSLKRSFRLNCTETDLEETASINDILVPEEVEDVKLEDEDLIALTNS
jgi:pantothenate kinase